MCQSWKIPGKVVGYVRCEFGMPNSYSFGSSSAQRPQVDWKEILFEIRALLHEPTRYHPNIVRLLGIQWGLSPISESTFPVLLMEYASLGSLKSLQSSQNSLPVSVKQKLCYDVGRGLSALHACGIVHGDMKHENVLIFPFEIPENARSADADGQTRNVLYTAKLADFGGTVMDMTPFEARKLKTGTPPFEAPEVTNDRLLKKYEMMLTDVYSFGLLVWRLFEDGRGILSLPGAFPDASNEDVQRLRQLKASENLTQTAIRAIQAYATANQVHERFVQMFSYVILHTVRFNPQERNLVKAQAALRGIKYVGMFENNNHTNRQKSRCNSSISRAYTTNEYSAQRSCRCTRELTLCLETIAKPGRVSTVSHVMVFSSILAAWALMWTCRTICMYPLIILDM